MDVLIVEFGRLNLIQRLAVFLWTLQSVFHLVMAHLDGFRVHESQPCGCIGLQETLFFGATEPDLNGRARQVIIIEKVFGELMCVPGRRYPSIPGFSAFFVRVQSVVLSFLEEGFFDTVVGLLPFVADFYFIFKGQNPEHWFLGAGTFSIYEDGDLLHATYSYCYKLLLLFVKIDESTFIY